LREVGRVVFEVGSTVPVLLQY